jgi:excisionase family DNA binding protein
MTDMDDGQPVTPAVPRLMTTAEAAEFVRRSERTVRDWVRRGLLKRRRVGRGVYFLEADVLAGITGESENHKPE